MSRITPFASPLLLGFDAMEKTLERISKASDGYPPYNIERIAADTGAPERLRITLAWPASARRNSMSPLRRTNC